MPKSSTVFECNSCSYQSPKWVGQCPDCGEWNTFSEVIFVSNKSKNIQSVPNTSTNLTSLNNVKVSIKGKIGTQLSELDRVLGGGVMEGQVVLIGGEPGIGKSTLLLQLSNNFATMFNDASVLYVAGEESAVQIKSRAERLKIKASNIEIYDNTNAEEVTDYISLNAKKYSLIIVDSIQSMSIERLISGFGSVSQVKESASLLTHIAKKTNIPMFIVGQITKEGSIAGPKILEHIVDTVLYFEGDNDYITRMLRCTKNRFGSVNEVGLFEMDSSGLKSIENPAEIFLSEKATSSGSVVCLVLEGSRVLAVEVQALVTKTSFGFPKRTASGFNLNRLNLLLAVMEKRAGLKFYDQDVYLNVASGLNLKEPAVDLAVCIAIASSLKDKVVKKDICIVGEVGLGGEIRKVAQQGRRLTEGKNLGFKNVISNNKYKTVAEVVKELFS